MGDASGNSHHPLVENHNTHVSRPEVTLAYGYDTRGNLTYDGRKGLEISYNLANLPLKVMKTDSTDSATFVYLADGTKHMSTDGAGNILRYRGSYLFRNGQLQSVAWKEGIYTMEYDNDSWCDHLYVKDRLGNVRSIVAVGKNVGNPASYVTISQEDYTPYGTRVDDMSKESPVEKFIGTGGWFPDTHRRHLGGKEEVPEGGLDLLDFGARYYDPYLCRWTSIDPLAEKYPWVSPYAYCNGNPRYFTDRDGREIRFAQDASPEFILQVMRTFMFIYSRGANESLSELIKSDKVYTISQSTQYKNEFQSETQTILWNPDLFLEDIDSQIITSPTRSLLHEIEHAVRYDREMKQYGDLELTDMYRDYNTPDSQYGNKEERRVIEGPEQVLTRLLGEIRDDQFTRKSHSNYYHKMTNLSLYPWENTPEKYAEIVRRANNNL